MNAVECSGVTKRYGRKKVLEELDLTIGENKLIGLIGRNGAGKTTLLKLISGFIRPQSGEIRVFAEEPFDNLYVAANRIMIDDRMIFPPVLSLEDIMRSAESFYPGWNADLAWGLFSHFSLSKKQHYDRLSKGTKSTFNMIIGLSAGCALTIFDEPTTGMDAASRKDFYRALLKDYIARPRTIILSSHHLNEVEDLLEEVVLLKDGKVRLYLPVSDMKEWAVGVQDNSGRAKEWLENKEVLHERKLGPAGWQAVVRNDFSEEERQRGKRSGLVFTNISADELSIYLTDDGRGGIDDVFASNETV